MEQHRKSAVCASCHARMDPLGFGLENFNAIGSWRTQDGNAPVDSTGALPDGRRFQTPNELKQILKADRQAFARGMVEKMLTYALGRGLQRYDRPAVNAILADAETHDYRISAIVLGIVRSMPFQMRGPAAQPQNVASSQRSRATMNFLTRKHVSRRTMLRGLGSAVALPFLDAMCPALAGPTARE